MSKLSVKFLIWTFAIMLLCWVTCAVCSINGVLLKDNAFLYIPYILGGFSPTIASYIVLKQTGNVKNFWSWLKGVFDFKNKPLFYLLVILLSIVAILPRCFISGYELSAPSYSIIIAIPMMIFGGGLEEAGWRHILQPELEEKFGFSLATILVSIIWCLWHLPLFFIAGVSQYGTSYLIFGVGVLGTSFALAAIKKKTGSTWLCVLFHALTNAYAGTFIFNDNNIMLGSIVSSVFVIVISCVWVKTDRTKKSLS